MDTPVNTPLSLLGNTVLKAPKSKERLKECKQYCFTYNNYTKENTDKLINTLNTLGKWVFGFEVGEQGTPHLQGYINLNGKKTMRSLINHIDIPQIHFAECKGSEKQNIAYCTKDGNYKSNFLEEPYVEEIDNFYEWEQYILNLIKGPPNKRTIYYFYEPKGCKGKTTFQKYIITHYKKVLMVSGKGSDMKNGVLSYREKQGFFPEIILINIPRDSFNFVSWTGIEEIKDMLFYSGKYEGGMVCHKCPHVFIFANEPPPYHRVSLDRWEIYRLENDNCIKEEINESDDEN